MQERLDREAALATVRQAELRRQLPNRQERARAAERARNVYDFGPPRSAAERRIPLSMIPRRQGQGSRRNRRGR